MKIRDNYPETPEDFFKLPVDHDLESKLSPLYSSHMPTGYRDENGDVWILTITDGEFTRQKTTISP